MKQNEFVFRLCLRLSQTQPQFGRQGDWAFSPVSSPGPALQRPIQHPQREARAACHQGQVQGPDRGGRGEEAPVANYFQPPDFRPVKSSRTKTWFSVALVFMGDNFVLCYCRRASATHTSGRGVWKVLWRFVFVCPALSQGDFSLRE